MTVLLCGLQCHRQWSMASQECALQKGDLHNFRTFLHCWTCCPPFPNPVRFILLSPLMLCCSNLGIRTPATLSV